MNNTDRVTLDIEFKAVKIVLLSGILITVDFLYGYDFDSEKTTIEVLETVPRIVHANMEELNDLFDQLRQYARAQIKKERTDLLLTLSNNSTKH